MIRAGQGVVKVEEELPSSIPSFQDSVWERLKAPTTDHRWCIAWLEGEGMVAEASIERLPMRMLRHGASVGIGVHPAAQGLGVGRRLMEVLLDWADDQATSLIAPLTRVELSTRADNLRALALYRSLGFEIEGVRRRFVRLPSGAHVDDYCMSLALPRRAR